jgi:hypothetical protein
LANRGCKIHKLADGELSPADLRMRGLAPGKNPDFLIEGKVYDAYGPTNNDPASAYSGIAVKVDEGQTQNVVVNLGRSGMTRAELENQLLANPIENLKEVLIIGPDGSVGRLRT